jgi:hypothetical protein
MVALVLKADKAKTFFLWIKAGKNFTPCKILPGAANFLQAELPYLAKAAVQIDRGSSPQNALGTLKGAIGLAALAIVSLAIYIRI